MSWTGIGTAALLLVALNGFISLRLRNLDTEVLKVNDANGNPIEISAVITWQVHDAAQAARGSPGASGSSAGPDGEDGRGE